MDIFLFVLLGVIAYATGRVSSPKEEVVMSDLSDKERKELEYQRTLNQSLLSEVQQYRALETQLRVQLWDTKKELKKLQGNDQARNN
jgi:hypothetical protein